MLNVSDNPVAAYRTASASAASPLSADTVASAEIARKFERMLWSEMLSHSGLEKALTQNGGEEVSAFARYIVEAIAEDIAEKHPLGLGANSLKRSSTETGGAQ